MQLPNANLAVVDIVKLRDYCLSVTDRLYDPPCGSDGYDPPRTDERPLKLYYFLGERVGLLSSPGRGRSGRPLGPSMITR
jgi:hypothetical protein